MEPERRERTKQLDFDAFLEQSIEDGLLHVCGQSGLQLVLSLYPLKQISTDPAVFHKILREVFQETGAIIIEREVARRLLERVGNEMAAKGNSPQSRLATVSSKGREPVRVSRKEKEVLRQFLELEPFPKGHAGKPGATPIDLTVAQFAHAFKKGS